MKYWQNKNKGFLQLIVVLVIAIFLMSYFHVTARDVWEWFINALNNVF